jgi:spore coat protein CotH
MTFDNLRTTARHRKFCVTWTAVLLLLCCSGNCVAVEPQLSADRLFEPHHLVDVKITVPKADWDTIRVQTRNFVEALSRDLPKSPFTYVKADIEIDGVLIQNVGLRKKGFLGSLNDERPSLKIKFDKYEQQSPIAGLDRLTLNNNHQDASRLSQYMGYRFFNASGTFASRCNLAKVTVNGTYLGLYSNVESIKEPMLQRGFGDGSGALFEGTVVDFYEDFVEKFEQKNKVAESEPIRQISKVLAQENVDVEKLNTLIDVDAFVKFWATESLLGFWDGYNNDQNNFFCYQSPANSKFYFIPWGADALFTETMPIPPYVIFPQFVYSRALLPNKLYRIPQIQKQYHETLNQLLDEHWKEEELIAELDHMEALLKDSVREDNAKFAGAVNSIRRFIKSRRGRLMKEMESGPVQLKSLARRPAYMKEVGRVIASFETKWYDQLPEDSKQLGQAQLVVELDGERVELSQLGVYAEHSKWPPVPEGTPKPPAIVFVGTRKSNGNDFIVGMGLPIEKFHPTKGKTVEIGGIIIDGPFGAPGSKTTMLSGTATFEKAGMNDGAMVIGRVKLTASELKDGEPKK